MIQIYVKLQRLPGLSDALIDLETQQLSIQHQVLRSSTSYNVSYLSKRKEKRSSGWELCGGNSPTESVGEFLHLSNPSFIKY